MRPKGDIALALRRAWEQGPAPVRHAAQRSCVGLQAARYTASRMLDRGELVVAQPGRPAVLALAAEVAAPAQPAQAGSCMQAFDNLHMAFWGGRR